MIGFIHSHLYWGPGKRILHLYWPTRFCKYSEYFHLLSPHQKYFWMAFAPLDWQASSPTALKYQSQVNAFQESLICINCATMSMPLLRVEFGGSPNPTGLTVWFGLTPKPEVDRKWCVMHETPHVESCRYVISFWHVMGSCQPFSSRFHHLSNLSIYHSLSLSLSNHKCLSYVPGQEQWPGPTIFE